MFLTLFFADAKNSAKLFLQSYTGSESCRCFLLRRGVPAVSLPVADAAWDMSARRGQMGRNVFNNLENVSKTGKILLIYTSAGAIIYNEIKYAPSIFYVSEEEIQRRK